MNSPWANTETLEAAATAKHKIKQGLVHQLLEIIRTTPMDFSIADDIELLAGALSIYCFTRALMRGKADSVAVPVEAAITIIKAQIKIMQDAYDKEQKEGSPNEQLTMDA